MQIAYDSEKLQQIINDLAVLTGFSLTFLDADGNSVCGIFPSCRNFCTHLQKREDLRTICAENDELLLKKCKRTGQFESHICHAGLFDAVMPIAKNGILAGIILMGRVRIPTSFQTTCTEDETAKKLFDQMPKLSDAQIASFKTLLPDILFENAIHFVQDSVADEAANYIRENLKENISLSFLCKHFNISKNNLYREFHQKFGTTVNEYITKVRIEKATELLKQQNMPVYLVCEQVGILNYTYFCKLFKKKMGVTPTEYKKREIG